ncbi:MAG: DUF2304 domain-containing protein [Candidatus Omnitrophica bacterium]|nr:DUF2304 domain-containing protein [Candidatus Omnitrophota bacterium]
MIFQILVISYAVLTILNAVFRRQKFQITFWFFASLVLSHLGIIVITLFPNVTYPIAHFFGIGRGADFVLYTAVIIILRILFYLYSQNRRLEQQLTHIVRHLALTEKEGNHSKRS